MKNDLRNELKTLLAHNPLTLSEIFQKSSSTSYADITSALEDL